MTKNFYLTIFDRGAVYKYKINYLPQIKTKIYFTLKEYFKKIQQIDFSISDIINIIGEENLIETSEVKIEGVTYLLSIVNSYLNKSIKLSLTSVYNYKEYIINTDIIVKGESNGNCIDNLIEKIIIPKLKQLEKYSDNILSRKIERMSDTEYHNTLCYEQDFRQIVNIKEIGEKIVECCNKQLEGLLENYTKS